LDSIAAVESFTSECAKTGRWNGEAVEGFVVRTHVTKPRGGRGNHKSREESPYEAGSSFFFKVKFDEPYMMYRDWRELTKALLSKGGNALSARKLPKGKMKRPETQVYVRWVVEEMRRDRGLFEGYTKGRGIIEIRERFLRWVETEEGREMLEKAKNGKLYGFVSAESVERPFGKTIILPVAVPGCGMLVTFSSCFLLVSDRICTGKTSVAVALAHLFGFAHTQSDDVHTKKAAPKFLKNVTSLLHKNDIVIADKYVLSGILFSNLPTHTFPRNNHLSEHRRALRTHTRKFTPPIRLLALHWSIADKPSTHAVVHRICADRVRARGANHQTLRADLASGSELGAGRGSKGMPPSYEDVIWTFIREAEELGEDEVDAVVDMEVEEGLDAAVRRAVAGCVDVLGVERPSEERIDEVLEVVRGYVPTTTTDQPVKHKMKDGAVVASAGVDEKNFTPRYYALQAEVDLEDLLGEKFAAFGQDADADGAITQAALAWEKLKAAGRVSKHPHITIVHQKSMPKLAELWNLCAALHTLEEPPQFKATLGTLIWNERVLAITVERVEVVREEDKEGEWRGKAPRLAKELLEKMEEEEAERWLHLTVGTLRQSVPAVEAKDLVEEFRKSGVCEGGPGLGGCLGLDGLVVYGRIRGLMH
jgi:tRNA ligase